MVREKETCLTPYKKLTELHFVKTIEQIPLAILGKCGWLLSIQKGMLHGSHLICKQDH